MSRWTRIVTVGMVAFLCTSTTVQARTAHHTTLARALHRAGLSQLVLQVKLDTVADDIKVGALQESQMLAAFAQHHRAVDAAYDANVSADIQAIVARIAPHTDNPDLPYSAHLVGDDTEANAMCGPGGKIFIFSGLWKGKAHHIRARTDELAVVLGHEMAHGALRHAAQSYKGFIHTSPVEIESEADRAGMRYMAMSGFDPRAAVRVFARLVVNNRTTHDPHEQRFVWRNPTQARRDAWLKDNWRSHPSYYARLQIARDMLPEALKLYRAAKQK